MTKLVIRLALMEVEITARKRRRKMERVRILPAVEMAQKNEI